MIWMAVEILVTKYKTTDPFELADSLDITVRSELLPSYIRGIFTRIFGYAYIVLNSELDNNWKRAICAHELGHAVLHNHLDYKFITMNTLFIASKYEREANIFAGYLLMWDNPPMEGEPIEKYARRIQAPVDILTYAYENTHMRGM